MLIYFVHIISVSITEIKMNCCQQLEHNKPAPCCLPSFWGSLCSLWTKWLLGLVPYLKIKLISTTTLSLQYILNKLSCRREWGPFSALFLYQLAEWKEWERESFCSQPLWAFPLKGGIDINWIELNIINLASFVCEGLEGSSDGSNAFPITWVALITDS